MDNLHTEIMDFLDCSMLCSVVIGVHFNPDDDGSTFLKNFGIQPPHYTVRQPRKPWILSSLSWKLQISQHPPR